MKSNKILVVGNCIVDQVWELEYFPQQNEEMRASSNTQVMGGNACNSAQILVKLGNDVELISNMAQDSLADWLLQELSDKGISSRFCSQLPGFSTPQSVIWLNAQNGSRTIVHHRNLAELSLSQLTEIPVFEYRWIHFEGRNVKTLLKYLTQLDVTTVSISLELEKNRSDIELLLPFVNTVIVSSDYLQSSKLTPEQCFQYLNRYNTDLNIVCTLGASGITAKQRTGELINLAAEPVKQVVDSIGAGDCFIAGLIHRLNQQDDFKSALIYANHLAAQKIQYKGLKFDDE